VQSIQRVAQRNRYNRSCNDAVDHSHRINNINTAYMDDLKTIKDTVEEYYAKELCGRSLADRTRLRHVVTARQMYYHFACALTGNTMKRIGEYVGGFSHSNVICGDNHILGLAQYDKKIRRDMEELSEKVINNLK
jgi:chromosomal replication initiation ATPase DnaA